MSARGGLPELNEIFAARFRIDERLGRGGYGAVYRAQDLATGSSVALKVLRPEQFDSVGPQRFAREAQLASQLDHPNIVRMLGHGQAPSGAPFIAFELLSGCTLAQGLRRHGAMPPPMVLQLATQVAQALGAAHNQGVIHRDIKPANIFLVDGRSDQVKVLDFGIAKPLDKQLTKLTNTGVVVGSPRFMAPEQLSSGEIGPWTDLYALGLVMAEALCGTRVYFGTAIEICMQQLSSDPVPLPPMVLTTPLAPVVERATEKAISQRYRSAAQLLDGLRSEALELTEPMQHVPDFGSVTWIAEAVQVAREKTAQLKAAGLDPVTPPPHTPTPHSPRSGSRPSDFAQRRAEPQRAAAQASHSRPPLQPAAGTPSSAPQRASSAPGVSRPSTGHRVASRRSARPGQRARPATSWLAIMVAVFLVTLLGIGVALLVALSADPTLLP